MPHTRRFVTLTRRSSGDSVTGNVEDVNHTSFIVYFDSPFDHVEVAMVTIKSARSEQVPLLPRKFEVCFEEVRREIEGGIRLRLPWLQFASSDGGQCGRIK